MGWGRDDGFDCGETNSETLARKDCNRGKKLKSSIALFQRNGLKGYQLSRSF